MLRQTSHAIINPMTATSVNTAKEPASGKSGYFLNPKEAKSARNDFYSWNIVPTSSRAAPRCDGSSGRTFGNSKPLLVTVKAPRVAGRNDSLPTQWAQI
jgi:hypothetical protein